MQNNNVKFKAAKDIVVIYHGGCPDGFSAAWVAWKKFGDKAEYIPGHHGNPIPENLNGKEIYMLDFVYPVEEMKKIVQGSKKVVVIDHHKSAEESVKIAQEYLYEMNHSGATLSWKYFYPNTETPWLIRYVEDMDLWKLELPDVFAVAMVVNNTEQDFDIWTKLAKDFDDDTTRNKQIEQGNIILKFENKLTNEIMDSNKEIVKFEGYETYAVNAPHVFASQMGNALCKEKPPIAIIWQRSGGKLEVSLRSDGSVDVSEIAKKYGGGGHKAAAGFMVVAEQFFPWKIIKDKK